VVKHLRTTNIGIMIKLYRW